MNAIQAPTLDEESRGLMRRVLERMAWRQVMLANIRGHALKYLPEVAEKDMLARDLVLSLSVLHDVEALHAESGGENLTLSTRDLLERIPYPYSRLELAVCLALFDRAERLVASSYLDSRCAGLAAVAHRVVEMDRTTTRRLEEVLVSFCQERGNRPTAQQFLNRWLALTIVAFGRPNTGGDKRAVVLGLRSRHCAESVRQHLEDLAPLLAACQLALPDKETLGVEVA